MQHTHIIPGSRTCPSFIDRLETCRSHSVSATIIALDTPCKVRSALHAAAPKHTSAHHLELVTWRPSCAGAGGGLAASERGVSDRLCYYPMAGATACQPATGLYRKPRSLHHIECRPGCQQASNDHHSRVQRSPAPGVQYQSATSRMGLRSLKALQNRLRGLHAPSLSLMHEAEHVIMLQG